MRGQLHVLAVDDEVHILELLRHTFEGEGFRVTCVGDADSAIHILETDVPDLVLLDVVMTGKDGYHVLQHITQGALGIPVVFLTARSEKTEMAEALGLGADDYVTKPFSTQELLARVKGILRRVG